jgi:hypothetical protein
VSPRIYLSVARCIATIRGGLSAVGCSGTV